MKKRSAFIFGLLAAALALSLVLTGCDNGSTSGGYTVKFKIENTSTDIVITKIEFLDDNDFENALRGTITEPLAVGTKEYSVNGFIKFGGQINVAVKVYYTDSEGAAQTAENDYSFQTDEEKADPKKKFKFDGYSLSRQSTY